MSKILTCKSILVRHSGTHVLLNQSPCLQCWKQAVVWGTCNSDLVSPTEQSWEVQELIIKAWGEKWSQWRLLLINFPSSEEDLIAQIKEIMPKSLKKQLVVHWQVSETSSMATWNPSIVFSHSADVNIKGIRLESIGGTTEVDGAATRKQGAGELKDEKKLGSVAF